MRNFGNGDVRHVRLAWACFCKGQWRFEGPNIINVNINQSKSLLAPFIRKKRPGPIGRYFRSFQSIGFRSKAALYIHNNKSIVSEYYVECISRQKWRIRVSQIFCYSHIQIRTNIYNYFRFKTTVVNKS